MKFKVACYTTDDNGKPLNPMKTAPVCVHYYDDLDSAEDDQFNWESSSPEGCVCTALIYETNDDGLIWEQV